MNYCILGFAHLRLVSHEKGIGKQCSPRSDADAAECSISSGSILHREIDLSKERKSPLCINGLNMNLLKGKGYTFKGERQLYYVFDLSETLLLLGALHRRSKFANFCHDIMQNYLS